MTVQSNWWETFFEGVAVELWLSAISTEQTEREADVIQGALNAPQGGELLDIPCGGGRLSLALARRGFRITGIDWSSESLQHAASNDTKHAITWERRDMRDLPWRDRFDGAFCFGNSFGYLDDAGNAAFLRSVAVSLKRGARFVLETPMVLENLLRHLQPRPWWKVGDVHLLVANSYDPTTGRLEIEYTFVANGRVDVRYGSHRAYTYRALVQLIDDAGFDVTLDRPWTRDAHMVTFIATKR